VGEGEERGSEFRVYAGPTVRRALGFPRDGKGAGYAGRLSDPPEGGTPNDGGPQFWGGRTTTLQLWPGKYLSLTRSHCARKHRSALSAGASRKSPGICLTAGRRKRGQALDFGVRRSGQHNSWQELKVSGTNGGPLSNMIAFSGEFCRLSASMTEIACKYGFLVAFRDGSARQ
jgi:hypothetical protein